MAAGEMTMPGLDKKPSKATERVQAASRAGLALERFFSRPGVDPFSEIEWELRSAVIAGEDGRVVFEQRDVEVPRAWSQTATNVVVSKYFRGPLGSPRRESSVRQLIGRVVDTIAGWGERQGYFADDAGRDTFKAELTSLLVTQRAAFNSPVYFNVGIEPKPQCSACFILKVDDNMDSILNWYRNEGIIFKGGSGAGVNLSAVRSCREKLSAGGTASGPLSFMKAADASAGVIKSGGKTRRAAKMVVLNADHPDIELFIKCKQEEERKAWALIDAGYDSSLDGPAYGSVFFQNANNSVRATDEFMRAVAEDGEWTTHLRQGPQGRRDVQGARPDADDRGGGACLRRSRDAIRYHDQRLAHLPQLGAHQRLQSMQRVHASGQLGLQPRVHQRAQVPRRARRVRRARLSPRGRRDDHGAGHSGRQLLVSDRGNRPQRARLPRTGTGLREPGRPADGARAALRLRPGTQLRGRDNRPDDRGGLPAVRAHRAGDGPVQRLCDQPRADAQGHREHREKAYESESAHVPLGLLRASREAWDEALKFGESAGYRNSQATVIAPTGTIAFMMDCDTTGIEPDIALVKYKKLVGGGMLKIVNGTVPRALKRIGYDSREVQEIVEYLDEHETIEGAPHLADAHLPVFDCAFKPRAGARTIHYHGPFAHDGRSAAVHLGRDFQDHQHAGRSRRRGRGRGLHDGVEAGTQGGRDLSRRLQAHPATQHRQGQGREHGRSGGDRAGGRRGARAASQKMPDERKSITHKFDIAGHEGYITVGMYEDGKPGEIFVMMSKQGSTISGLMDSFATAISYALQYGVPLQFLVDKFSHMRFEPSGFTKNPRDSVRQVDRRLPVPMARVQVPRRRGPARNRGDRTRGARRYGDCINDNGRTGAGRGSRGRCSGRARGGAGARALARARHSSIRPTRRRVRIADA